VSSSGADLHGWSGDREIARPGDVSAANFVQEVMADVADLRLGLTWVRKRWQRRHRPKQRTAWISGGQAFV